MAHNLCVNVIGLSWCDNSEFVVSILPQWRLLPSSAFLSFEVTLFLLLRFHILHWYSYSLLFVWIQIWLSCAVFHDTFLAKFTMWYFFLFEKIESEETNICDRKYITLMGQMFFKEHTSDPVCIVLNLESRKFKKNQPNMVWWNILFLTTI